MTSPGSDEVYTTTLKTSSVNENATNPMSDDGSAPRRARRRVPVCPERRRGLSKRFLNGSLMRVSPFLYSARRASMARPKVSSSAYSRSPPTGSPLARRVTVMPSGLMVRAR